MQLWRVEMEEAVGDVERLIMEHHYHSALQKLVEMQKLYPCILHLLPSMLTLCQVLSAANLHLPPFGVDHYWVLNASPLLSPCRIRAHYDHILTSLLPLKTNFPAAAHSALEAVETAFSVISDHPQRSLFDSRRNAARQHFLLNPSQDFFDFDAQRESCHLEEGQIWAANSLSSEHRYGRVSFKGPVCWISWLSPVPVSPSERRWRDSGLPVSCGTFEVGPDESDPGIGWRAYNCDWVRGALEGQFEIYPHRGEVWAIYKDWSVEEWTDRGPNALKRSKLDLVEIVSEFSKYTGVHCALLGKVNGFGYVFERASSGESLHVHPSMLYMFSHRVPSYRFTGGEIEGVTEGMLELDGAALPRCVIRESAFRRGQESGYRQDRERAFRPGQIWAVCCGVDSMPRQYARVDVVVSDLEVRVTFLEPVVTTHTETEWNNEKLPIVCGVFKVGTATQEVQVSRFSYVVKCRQRNHPFYVIHPMRGEIWAIYNNWNNKWKQSDHQAYDCHIVLILSDASQGGGTRIARLHPVEGCLTFFHNQQRHGFDLACILSNAEALSFSHRIPAFRVPGIATHGIPEASWHLEPSALPPVRRARLGYT